VTELNIEVEAFWGDNDTHNEMWMIGPFASKSAQVEAWHKLKSLPGNNGDALFSYCWKPMAAADNYMTAERLELVTTFGQLVDAFEYGPPPK